MRTIVNRSGPGSTGMNPARAKPAPTRSWQGSRPGFWDVSEGSESTVCPHHRTKHCANQAFKDVESCQVRVLDDRAPVFSQFAILAI